MPEAESTISHHAERASYDVIVVGAGFSGLYALHTLRGQGLQVRVLEAGSGVGGTWYWNRYPGARCDVQSIEYSYSFDEALQQEWIWSERYPAQPEIERYLNHVADRFGLRPDIQFGTCVAGAAYDPHSSHWTITTTDGARFNAHYVVMATGCLSTWRIPEFPGLDSFEGQTLHTATWPQEGVDLTGKRVGIIGTGSTGVQLIPQLAGAAETLHVFQRTANFSIPAHNRPLDAESLADTKANYPALRNKARTSIFGRLFDANDKSVLEATPEEREAEFESRWQDGGFTFLCAFSDLIFTTEANDMAADFVRNKIRGIVHDRSTADLLCPDDHPLGSKRMCVDISYFETYNRDNVTLVDVRTNPITEITPTGIRTSSGDYDLDVIIYATGFDAMTGALTTMHIQGVDGVTLRDKWTTQGPFTYLGVATAGFPNLFIVTGPGSPSVLGNVVVSIEQHVEWISGCIEYLQRQGAESIAANQDAEQAWMAHVNEIAEMTLFPRGNSWYNGANIPGKKQLFMPYAGGVGAFREKCDEVALKGYEGFTVTYPGQAQ